MRVEEVAQELGISKSHAYKVIHKLNAELREKGYLTCLLYTSGLAGTESVNYTVSDEDMLRRLYGL